MLTRLLFFSLTLLANAMTDSNPPRPRAIEYDSSSESEIEEPFVSEQISTGLVQATESPASETLTEGLTAMDELLNHSLNQKTLAAYKVCYNLVF